MNLTKTLIASSLFALGSLNADIIIQYDTLASTTDPTLTATIADGSISADLMTTGGGLTAASGSTWNWNQWDTASTSFADAVAAGDTWTWGFSVTTADTLIDLTTFDIRLDRSGTGPDDFEIVASVNGGSNISLLTFDYADSSSGVDFLGVDLSAIPTLATGDAITFTLGAFNSEGSTGTFDLETVDFGGSDPRALRVEGIVSAVPEPSTYAAMAGLMVLGLVMVRRRRK